MLKYDFIPLMRLIVPYRKLVVDSLIIRFDHSVWGPIFQSDRDWATLPCDVIQPLVHERSISWSGS